MDGRWAAGFSFLFALKHYIQFRSKWYGGVPCSGSLIEDSISRRPALPAFPSSPQQFQKCFNLRPTFIIKGRFTVSSFFNSGRLTQPDPLASNYRCNKPKVDTEILSQTVQRQQCSSTLSLILSFHFQVMLVPPIKKKRDWCMVS